MKARFITSLMRRAITSDVVYIQKLPLPGGVVKALNILCEKIIFDFDDAIYIDKSGQERSKVKRWLNACLDCSSLVITGNPNLSKYAKNYNNNVKTLPTPVPKEEVSAANKPQENDITTIGWVGHPSNLPYLNEIERPLRRLLMSEKAELRIVTDVGKKYGGPFADVSGESVIYDRWELNTEAEKISKFDFSIRPIPDTLWNQCKGGYTSIVRCISLGIPVISSPLETLKQMLPPGGPILFADSSAGWSRKMKTLIKDNTFRHELRRKGRSYIDQQGLWTEDFASDISGEIQELYYSKL